VEGYEKLSSRKVDMEYVKLAYKMWLYNRIGKLLAKGEKVPEIYIERLK
jgi:hypothetical protein